MYPRHSHRPVAALAHTIPWTHCVAAAGNCSGAAHGGVCYVEECSCGARRMSESNGRHQGRGRWQAPPEALAYVIRTAGTSEELPGGTSLREARRTMDSRIREARGTGDYYELVADGRVIDGGGASE